MDLDRAEALRLLEDRIATLAVTAATDPDPKERRYAVRYLDSLWALHDTAKKEWR